MKRLLIVIILFSFSQLSIAQDFTFGSVKPEEVTMTKYANDTSAHAVILNEFGDAKLNLHDYGSLRIFYQYHVRIKLLDNSEFKRATVEIPLYLHSKNSDLDEDAYEIRGATIYQDENGKVKTESLTSSMIFTVKENASRRTVKFTLPSVRKGCVIEYSYRFLSPYFENFHEWLFQDNIPKVKSRFEGHIPAFCQYNASLRGGLKLSKNTSDREPQCFNLGGGLTDCLHLTYEMANIPAFVAEDFMTTPKNFMSGVFFELSEYTDPYSDKHVKVAKDWADVDKQLKEEERFGLQLQKKDILKNMIPLAVINGATNIDKAKNIYHYIQNNVKWNKFYGVVTDDIKTTLNKHTGSVSDINIALVCALNAAGLKADPVLLSTRDHGVINKLYPVITEFNYVIAKVDVDEKTYLLDATEPLLSFGLLPMRCLNDQGRVVSLTKPSYWIDINANQKQSNTFMSDLTLQPDGKITGTLTIISKGYSAFEKREAIKKFNTVDEYVEDKDEKMTGLKIIKSNIINVDSLDLPISESYDIEINAFKNVNTQLNFNPFIFDKVEVNPFKLGERNYPVDWGMPSDIKYISTLHLPAGFSIENPPQSTSFSIPGQAAKFFTTYEGWENSFTFSYVTQFSKSVYSADDYLHLKELYNKIILAQKADITLKKNL